jgi:hypothetical protein
MEKLNEKCVVDFIKLRTDKTKRRDEKSVFKEILESCDKKKEDEDDVVETIHIHSYSDVLDTVYYLLNLLETGLLFDQTGQIEE